MTTTYGSSERIFAWLGVPFSKAETKLAVKMMHDCHICLRDGLAENDLTSLLATINSKHPHFPSELHSSTGQRGTALPTCSDDHISGGRRFIKKLAHLVQSTSIVGYSGLMIYFLGPPSHLPWASRNSKASVTRTITRTWALFFSNRSARARGTARSLVNLMVSMSGAACTDALDKVFAPLGLVQDLPVGRISVDYTRSVDQLFIDVARYIIADSGLDLEAFGMVYTLPPFTADENFSATFDPSVPSWVPDWRQRVYKWSMSSSSTLTADGQPLYNAWPGSEVRVRFSEREVELVGYVADHLLVQTMTDVFDEERTGADFGTVRAWRHDTGWSKY
jgi:hypothetical protein